MSGQAAGRRATVVSARRPDADAAVVDVTVGAAAAVVAAAAVDAGPGTG